MVAFFLAKGCLKDILYGTIILMKQKDTGRERPERFHMRVRFTYNGVARVGTIIGAGPGISLPGETSARPLNMLVQIDGMTHPQNFRAGKMVMLRSVEFGDIADPLVFVTQSHFCTNPLDFGDKEAVTS